MLKELRKKLDARQISSVELTEQYLRAIKEKNKELNAYVRVLEESALEQAKAADNTIASGEVHPLTGIPYALKDNYCVRGIETTACSRILQGYIPPYTASVVKRLRGAVLLGKTNMDEFAMGASTENSCFGPTRNPHDTSRVAGGSSGGSAAAVSADLAAFAFGSDTGGSIRQPASFCGVVGLRPTYGRISRFGVLAMASSMDTMGPFAKSVEDIAILFSEVAGRDTFDSTTTDLPVERYSEILERPLPKFRIGIPKEYVEVEGLNPDVRKVIEDVVDALRKKGHTIVSVSLPHTRYAVPTYYVLVPSEVSSNLARYDGIKYGYRAQDAEDLFSVYCKSRGQGFGAEAKRRIMIGTYTLSAGYYDAYYNKAMKVRTLIRNDFNHAFGEADVLLTPASPDVAFEIGAKSDLLQMYAEDIFTAPGALAGIPGLVVPAGEVNDLPVGIQIMGPQWSETRVLQVGHFIEHLLDR